jgi:RimJ/RimL family protein N-acetyltransferase
MSIIRRLNLGEGQFYRAVRLEALRESPDAFSSRYDDAVARSDQSWADQADSSAMGSDRATFVAIEDQPVGLAALYRDENVLNVGELIQMWVAPGVRGGSTATDLLLEIFRWAGSNRFSQVKAEVMRNNARALRFYVKFGFTVSADEAIHTGSSILLTKTVEQVSGGNGGATPLVRFALDAQSPPCHTSAVLVSIDLRGTIDGF